MVTLHAPWPPCVTVSWKGRFETLAQPPLAHCFHILIDCAKLHCEVSLKRVLCWKRPRYQAHYTSFNAVSGSSAETCEAFFPITAKVSGRYHLVAGQQQTLSQCYYNILPCLWNIKSIEFLRLKDIVIFENINFVAATLPTSLCLTNEFVGTGWMWLFESAVYSQVQMHRLVLSKYCQV